MYEQQYAGTQFAAQALNPSLGSIQLAQPSPVATLRQQAAAFRQSAEAMRRSSAMAKEQSDFMDKRAAEFEAAADVLNPVRSGQAFASAFPADVAQHRFNATHSPADIDGGYVANRIREMEDRPDQDDEATPNARRAVSGDRSYMGSFIREVDAIPPSDRSTRPMPEVQTFAMPPESEWLHANATDLAGGTRVGPVDFTMEVEPLTANEAMRHEDRVALDQQHMRQHALDAAMRSFGAALPISAGEVLKVADQFRRFLAGEPEPDKAPAEAG